MKGKRFSRLVPVVIVVAGVLALSHFAPFPFLFDAAAGKVSVWRIPQAPGQRQIYLTFDDGPNPAITPELLDILRERQVRLRRRTRFSHWCPHQ